LIRVESPLSVSGTWGDRLYATCSFFCAAFKPAISMVSSMILCRLKSWMYSESLFASIFEKSRMSVMSASRVSPEQRIVFTRSLCWCVSLVSPRSCPTAIIPFSGVRISWLILARNWLLASFADRALSAASLASISAFFLWISSVMSLWIPT